MPKLQAFLTGAFSQANRMFDEKRAAEAREKELRAREESQIRIAKATEKRPFTFRNKTGPEAQLLYDITKARELELIKQQFGAGNENMVNIGVGKSAYSYRNNNVFGSDTPQGALESLNNLSRNLQVRQDPGQDYGPVVDHVQTLLRSATQPLLVDEHNKDGDIFYFRPALEQFPGLNELARARPDLKIQEIFNTGIPEQILTDSRAFNSFNTRIGETEVQVFQPAGYVKADKPPEPGAPRITFIKYGTQNYLPDSHLTPYFVNTRWNPSTKAHEYGMGTALLSVMFNSNPAEREKAAWVFSEMYEKEILSNIPEDQRNTGVRTIQLAKTLAEVADRLTPNEFHVDQGGGKYLIRKNPYEHQELPAQVIQTANSSMDLVQTIVGDIDTLDSLLQSEDQEAGLVHGTATFLDRYLDPEGGLRGVIDEIGERILDIKDSFRNEYTERLIDGSEVDDVRKTEVGLFLEGMVDQTLNDQEFQAVLEAKNQRKRDGVIPNEKLLAKEREVIKRAQINLLKVKLGYQLAAMFQGGAGGRMISDQDLKIVMSALYAGANKQAQMAALNMLNVKLQQGYFKNYVSARYGASGKAYTMIDRFEPIFALRAKQALKKYNDLQKEAGGEVFTEEDLVHLSNQIEREGKNADQRAIPEDGSAEPNQMGE